MSQNELKISTRIHYIINK